MKDEFKLKSVSILIDQTQHEHKKGLFYLRATNVDSPLQSYGTPQEIGERFGQCLSNTLAAMQKNNCKIIKIELKWE